MLDLKITLCLAHGTSIISESTYDEFNTSSGMAQNDSKKVLCRTMMSFFFLDITL